MEKVYRKYPPKTSPSSKQPMHAKSSSENNILKMNYQKLFKKLT